MIAKHYGKSYSLSTLREYSFISREGSSLMGISDAAERIGFHTTGLKTSLEYLRERVTFPCVLHWNQNHYVVLYRIQRKRAENIYHIADPASCLTEYTEDEFKSHWLCTRQGDNERGLLLMLQPDSDFDKQEDEKEKEILRVGWRKNQKNRRKRG
jgi:ATP-binding cassette subfamily B protein